VVRPAGGKGHQLTLVEERRDHGDVRQVGAAAVGVVQDPAHFRLVSLVEHGCHRRGHRAQVHGDVLGLHHHPPAIVEEGG
jgi:hypothetical protein